MLQFLQCSKTKTPTHTYLHAYTFLFGKIVFCLFVGIIYTESNAQILSLMSSDNLCLIQSMPLPLKRHIRLSLQLIPYALPLGTTPILIFITIYYLGFPRTSNTQNYTVCTVSCLPSLTQHNVFWDSSLLLWQKFILFYFWGVSHHVNIPHFASPFSYWCSFGFSSLGLLRIKLLRIIFVHNFGHMYFCLFVSCLRYPRYLYRGIAGA